MGAVLLSTCTLQSTIVFATCVLQKTNPSQTRFSIRLQNATLEEFVKQVEQKTGYSFIYGEEVRLNGRITLAVRDLTINEILRKAFENQPIGFEISGKHILLNKRPVPQKTVSRRFTISGYVTDGASSETLIGANILDSHQSFRFLYSYFAGRRCGIDFFVFRVRNPAQFVPAKQRHRAQYPLGQQ